MIKFFKNLMIFTTYIHYDGLIDLANLNVLFRITMHNQGFHFGGDGGDTELQK